MRVTTSGTQAAMHPISSQFKKDIRPVDTSPCHGSMCLPSVFNNSVKTADEAEVEDRRTRAAIFLAGATLYSARAFLTERIKFWKLLNPATAGREKGRKE